MSAPQAPKRTDTKKGKPEKKDEPEVLGVTMEFSKFFRGMDKYYGQMVTDTSGDSRKGRRGWTASDGLTGENWEKHLKGTEPSLGITPIMEDGNCHFAAIDYDNHDADINQIEADVRMLGLPLVVCRSKSGGAHLYLFLSEPVKALDVRLKLNQWLALLKLENPDGRAVEIFPKQVRVTPSTQGNWIALPYFGGDKDKLRYAVHNGKKLNLKEFLAHAENTWLTRKEFITLFIPVHGSRLGDEAPPCLQFLDLQGIEEGGRNTYLFNLGILYKQMDPQHWETKLEEYNSRFVSPPMSARAIGDTIRSLARKDYTYQCDEQPLSTCCYSEQCSLRKFGITQLKSSKTDKTPRNIPEITDLIKIKTDPPMWTVMVDDHLVEGLETDDILILVRFRRAVMNKANVIFPNVKLDVWLNIVRRLMAGVEEVDAAEDAGVLGMFKGYFRQFLGLYRRANTREDVTKGQPFLDMPANMSAGNEVERYTHGRILFRSADLFKYLRDEHRFREYTPAQLFTVCRKMGARSDEVCINRRGVKVWHIPYAFIDEQQEKYSGEQEVKPIDI